MTERTEHEISDAAHGAERLVNAGETCAAAHLQVDALPSSSSALDEGVVDVSDDAFSQEEVSFFQKRLVLSDQPAGKDVFFSPGSIFVCCGEMAKGGVVNLALSSVFFIYCILVTVFHFFPVPGFVFLLVSLSLLWAGFVMTFRHRARKVVAGGRLFHLSFSIITFWFPLFISCILAFGFVMQRTWMGNDTMLPSLRQGDFVLVDRLSYLTRQPARGDLVLIESRGEGVSRRARRAFFARILAMPGDSVRLESGTVYVNDTPLSMYIPLDSMSTFASRKTLIAYESPYGIPRIDPQHGEVPEKWYPIQLSSQMLFTRIDTLTLQQDQYYVIEDNRDDVSLRYIKKSFGSIVHVSHIKGQPLFVLYNSQEESGFDRFGLRLR